MKKQLPLLLKALPYAVTLICLLFTLSFYCEGYSSPLVSDCLRYQQQIESGHITNWWSAVFMHEGRALMLLLQALGFHEADGKDAIFLIDLSCIFILYLSIALLSKQLSSRLKNGQCWQVLPSIVTAIALVQLGEEPYRLDSPGACLLVSSTLIIVSLYFTNSRKQKALLYLLFLFTSVHCFCFRKPYIILLPLFLLMIAWDVYRNKHSMAKACGAFATAAALSLLAYSGLNKLCYSSENVYPAQVMLGSDLKICSILSNRPNYFAEEFPEHMLIDLANVDEVGLKCIRTIGPDFAGILRHIHSKEEWNHLLRVYMQEWRENPREMLAARIIQSYYFLFSWYTPGIIRKTVHHFYPHVSVFGETFSTYFSPGYFWPGRRSIAELLQHLFALVLWLCGSFIPVWSFGRQIWKNKEANREQGIGLMLAAACFLSLACYLIVVPTADYRYRLQAVILASLSLSWWLCFHKTKIAQDVE